LIHTKLSEIDQGAIINIFSTIRLETKPCSHIVIKTTKIDDFVFIFNKHNKDIHLKYYINKVDDIWSEVYIFKYNHLIDVILFVCKHHNKFSVFSNWLQGKMFGISETMISEYVKDNYK